MENFDNPPPTPSTPTNAAKLDALLRLPSFSFPPYRSRTNKPPRPLFSPASTIPRALGASTSTGRSLGKQATVTRRVALIIHHAVQTRRLYPSMALNTEAFWDAALAALGREAPTMAGELGAEGMREVVGVYATGYAKAHGEDDDDEEDDSGVEEPREKLLATARAWCRIFRAHRDGKALPPPGGGPPPQKRPDEDEAAYAARLRETIRKLGRAQRAADARNQMAVELLHAQVDRMGDRLAEKERENRSLRCGFADEGGPWVPWRDYADALFGDGGRMQGGGG